MSYPPFTDICATRNTRRTPEWKLHRNLGMGKRSISTALDLYGFSSRLEFWLIVDNDGQLDWKLIWEGNTRADYDALPWVVDRKWRG